MMGGISMKNLPKRYKEFTPFTDGEAWFLFKIAAFAEAFGWTLLISGILCQKFITPGSKIPVLITGQIHGMLFLIYIVAAVVCSPSLGWSIKRTLMAGLFSVPPYGSLLFELWASSQRQKTELRKLSSLLYYRILLAP